MSKFSEANVDITQVSATEHKVTVILPYGRIVVNLTQVGKGGVVSSAVIHQDNAGMTFGPTVNYVFRPKV